MIDPYLRHVRTNEKGISTPNESFTEEYGLQSLEKVSLQAPTRFPLSLTSVVMRLRGAVFELPQVQTILKVLEVTVKLFLAVKIPIVTRECATVVIKQMVSHAQQAFGKRMESQNDHSQQQHE